jgi:hypothetical protein
MGRLCQLPAGRRAPRAESLVVGAISAPLCHLERQTSGRHCVVLHRSGASADSLGPASSLSVSISRIIYMQYFETTPTNISMQHVSHLRLISSCFPIYHCSFHSRYMRGRRSIRMQKVNLTHAHQCKCSKRSSAFIFSPHSRPTTIRAPIFSRIFLFAWFCWICWQWRRSCST